MAGVVGVDLDQARRASLEVAMHELERATREAVGDAGQRVIGARVVPGEVGGEVLVDIRFSGDRAGALAALERWKTTVPDVAGGSVILRTSLRGPDGLNREWWDDEYDKALQARERPAEAEFARQPGAQLPDGHARRLRRSWLTDWQEAARHPWKTRLFMVAAFALLGVIVAALAGDLTPWSLAVAAALGAVVGAAIGEYAMRAMRRLGAGNGRS